MKAPNEYAFDCWLDLLAVPHKYEALQPDIARAIRYQPDFWLPDSPAWLEIKRQHHEPTAGEARVARALVGADGHPVYIAAGWPHSDKLELWAYHPSGAYQHGRGYLALIWLARLVNRPMPEVRQASAEVERRHYEFVKAWQESQKEGNYAKNDG